MHANLKNRRKKFRRKTSKQTNKQPTNLPQKKGQPTKQEDAHDDAEGSGRFVFRPPALGLPGRCATWGSRNETKKVATFVIDTNTATIVIIIIVSEYTHNQHQMLRVGCLIKFFRCFSHQDLRRGRKREGDRKGGKSKRKVRVN